MDRENRDQSNKAESESRGIHEGRRNVQSARGEEALRGTGGRVIIGLAGHQGDDVSGGRAPPIPATEGREEGTTTTGQMEINIGGREMQTSSGRMLTRAGAGAGGGEGSGSPIRRAEGSGEEEALNMTCADLTRPQSTRRRREQGRARVSSSF